MFDIAGVGIAVIVLGAALQFIGFRMGISSAVDTQHHMEAFKEEAMHITGTGSVVAKAAVARATGTALGAMEPTIEDRVERLETDVARLRGDEEQARDELDQRLRREMSGGDAAVRGAQRQDHERLTTLLDDIHGDQTSTVKANWVFAIGLGLIVVGTVMTLY